ncbi:hypothetical protein SKB0120_18520 [Moraxella osloensis]|jgi:hypothetical protein
MSFYNLKNAFKIIGENTWLTLKDVYDLKLSYGETTISDCILLYLKKINNPKIIIWQTNQKDEAIFGTDWEWWIGSDKLGWVGYAVQAKKYHTKNDRYNSFHHPVQNRQQWEVLQDHARKWDLVPIYALYNYVLNNNFDAGIYTALDMYSKEMFGITVTPLHNIISALSTKGCRNFKFIHSKLDTIPLYELVADTKIILENRNNMKSRFFENFNPIIHPKLPKRFNNITNSQVLKLETKYENTVSAKRVLIIDIGKDDEPK